MTNHKQNAIEAGAEKLYPGLFSLSDNRYSIEFDNPVNYRETHQWEAIKEVGEVMDAMLPHLRAMIAEEILERLPESGPHINMTQYREGVLDGMNRAARIVEGPQQ